MGTKFVPLTPELIDEGEFLEDFASELSEAQRVLSNFRRTHGDAAAKAKCKLTIDVELAIASVDDDMYSIKTGIKVTHPKRPASVSLAVGGETEDNQPALFIRQSGSDKDDPRQGKLSTRDGRAIDTDSGTPILEADQPSGDDYENVDEDDSSQAAGE